MRSDGGPSGHPGGPFLWADQSDTPIGMRATLILIALLLAACGEKRPPAPTAEDNRQLDEAEAMLNADAANNVSR